jgi:hypothetical protein
VYCREDEKCLVCHGVEIYIVSFPHKILSGEDEKCSVCYGIKMYASYPFFVGRGWKMFGMSRRRNVHRILAPENFVERREMHRISFLQKEQRILQRGWNVAPMRIVQRGWNVFPMIVC